MKKNPKPERRKRKLVGISRAEFAELCGVSLDTVRYHISGGSDALFYLDAVYEDGSLAPGKAKAFTQFVKDNREFWGR